jgi:hypothetical protein
MNINNLHKREGLALTCLKTLFVKNIDLFPKKKKKKKHNNSI